MQLEQPLTVELLQNIKNFLKQPNKSLLRERKDMNTYKLLTPGPLTTTTAVKQEMLLDRCTWEDDYKEITQRIRTQLLELASATQEAYTTVLMQGSGSFVVESVLTSAISQQDKVLIVTNGEYGKRIVKMAQYIGLNYVEYGVAYNEYPKEDEIRCMLEVDKAITHIAMVHCETTTGILNPLEMISGTIEGIRQNINY